MILQFTIYATLLSIVNLVSNNLEHQRQWFNCWMVLLPRPVTMMKGPTTMIISAQRMDLILNPKNSLISTHFMYSRVPYRGVYFYLFSDIHHGTVFEILFNDFGKVFVGSKCHSKPFRKSRFQKN